MSEYQLTKKDILSIIESELDWCKQHPDPEGSQEWNNGYIAGVTNVKYLIQKAEETIKESRDRYIMETQFCACRVPGFWPSKPDTCPTCGRAHRERKGKREEKK